MDVKHKVQGKKVILYQGFFASVERRLEEFCQAINQMPSDYVMIAMGKGPNNYYDVLKKKYQSDKILFYTLYYTSFSSICNRNGINWCDVIFSTSENSCGCSERSLLRS